LTKALQSTTRGPQKLIERLERLKEAPPTVPMSQKNALKTILLLITVALMRKIYTEEFNGKIFPYWLPVAAQRNTCHLEDDGSTRRSQLQVALAVTRDLRPRPTITRTRVSVLHLHDSLIPHATLLHLGLRLLKEYRKPLDYSQERPWIEAGPHSWVERPKRQLCAMCCMKEKLKSGWLFNRKLWGLKFSRLILGVQGRFGQAVAIAMSLYARRGIASKNGILRRVRKRIESSKVEYMIFQYFS
jgi:hypothetical protein